MRQLFFIFIYLSVAGIAAAFYYYGIERNENPLPAIEETFAPEIKSTLEQIDTLTESFTSEDENNKPTATSSTDAAIAPVQAASEKRSKQTDSANVDDNIFLIPSPNTVKKLLDDVTTYQDMVNNRKTELDKQIKRDTE